MTHYESIFLLNTLIGNTITDAHSEEFFNGVANQASLVLEEANEVIDEAIDQDLQKLTAEVADVMVVALGLYQRLQRAGLPVDDVLQAVCDKNLMKFHIDPEEANKSVKFYQDQGVETFVRMIQLEDGSVYYGVIDKSNGKLRKPYNFTKLDISEFFEEEGNSADA